jgi:tetratricopeptide (TPR) repeat protein
MFEQIFLEKIIMNLSDQFMDEYKSQKTNFERFECLWNCSSSLLHDDLGALLTSTASVQSQNMIKDTAKSTSLRKDGNQRFESGQFNDAILKYNESLRYSLFNNENMALAHADRSIVFFELGEFQLCLNDIDLALRSDCPKDLAVGLYERQQKCYQRLNRFENSTELIEGLAEIAETERSKATVKFPFVVNKLIPSACAKITVDTSSSKGEEFFKPYKFPKI